MVSAYQFWLPCVLWTRGIRNYLWYCWLFSRPVAWQTVGWSSENGHWQWSYLFKYRLSFFMFQQDFRVTNSKSKKLDLGVVPVYVKLNITGHGVKLAVIDDGIEITHDDIKGSFVSY